MRTPLAVLKAQVQSARRGDVAPEQALVEISQTVERATTLANQMLSLAKVEQLRQQPESALLDLGDVVRHIALDLSPLVADKALDFELAADDAVTVRAHQWMLQELTRNLLHNAIKHSLAGAPLGARARRGRRGRAHRARRRPGHFRRAAPAPVRAVLGGQHRERLAWAWRSAARSFWPWVDASASTTARYPAPAAPTA